MKKLIGCILVLCVTAIYLISCEKDDICAETTPTTPNMIVSFYYNDNRTSYNHVTNLQYYEVDNEQNIISVGTVDSTRVPLRVDANHTKWAFVFNQVVANGIDKRTDYVDFKYTVWQEFVSRACGYKTQFLLDQDNPRGSNPVVTDGDGKGRWIQGIEIVRDSITDENEAHVKVYF
ncbi:DUF6452 family protein [Flavobacterium psychrotrophum]|uniref:DUF6452 family protein n=1 Tax=Flavobacterium psychrotrophum TaxID=2294119 RepID=UPI000E3167D1|nr:DUF6452 family protein [Flavobacterium psychrotrophum]